MKCILDNYNAGMILFFLSYWKGKEIKEFDCCYLREKYSEPLNTISLHTNMNAKQPWWLAATYYHTSQR